MPENSDYSKYLKALIEGDKDFCTRFIQNLIEKKVDIKSIYIDYFQKSLYEIGSLWEENKISVATEHLASATTERLMLILYPQIFSEVKNNKKVIVACVANEFHQIGAKMIADIFEMKGWDSFFVGSNTPINDLIKLIDDKQPDMVALSLSIYFNMNVLTQSINKVKCNFANIDIIVGGQAFHHGGVQAISHFKGVNYIESIYKLEERLDS
ncbi:MAG: B12-binding domain-containing protein [Bacteroidales bacterium]